MHEIKINTEYIRLDQLLKFSTVADTGGFAKVLIQEGMVHVNGEVATQRGRKIYPEDTVEVYVYDEDGNVEEIIVLKVSVE